MKVLSSKKCVIEFDATFLVLNLNNSKFAANFLRDIKQNLKLYSKVCLKLKSLTKLLAIIIRSAKAIYLAKLEDGVKKSVSF